MAKTVGVISLGCDKNRVDTERMLHYLKEGGFGFTADPASAQVLIVNTCSFISSAREEAVDTILEMAEYKKSGSCEKLIVTGCLPQRFLPELTEGFSEVDAYLGTASYSKICDVLNGLYAGEKNIALTACCDGEGVGRMLTTPQHYAYLKVSEGCSNRCSYCLIPSIRGAYVSRSKESLIAEADGLVGRGVKELILVGQDVTRYGADRGENNGLMHLLDGLEKVQGLKRIRLMYCYPEMVNGELLQRVGAGGLVARYLDIPFQHADSAVLKRMNRRSTAASLNALMETLRGKYPDIAVRSTFMVGFPGESEAELENLLAFIRRWDIENAGFFAYSAEEGTASFNMPGHIADEVKAERLGRAVQAGAEAMRRAQSRQIGRILPVIYEDIDYDKSLFQGRSEFQAPVVDGRVLFRGGFADAGETYNIRITGTDGPDLKGEMVK